MAEHVTEVGPADAPDRDLWRYALEQGAVIVMKDEDFADMVAIGRGEAPRLSGSVSATPGAQPCLCGSSR